MHGLHYNHQNKFTEKEFKEWSKKICIGNNTLTKI